MTAITATWMVHGARPVSGWLPYWRKAHSATRGIGYKTAPGPPCARSEAGAPG